MLRTKMVPVAVFYFKKECCEIVMLGPAMCPAKNILHDLLRTVPKVIFF